MSNIWFLKYRPSKLEEFVWKNDEHKKQISNMIEQKNVPHLLLTGPTGTGKTSLAKVIFKELNVHNEDILEINASLDNNVETVRNKIKNFAETWALGDMKYVLLDEADYLTVNSQAMLRNLLETYANNCRFILTANYENRIIPAIKGRCQTFVFDKLNLDEYLTKIVDILDDQKIEIDIDIVDSIVKASYPDLRKGIQFLQQQSYDGKLLAIDKQTSTSDYMLLAITAFKKKNKAEGRKIILDNARPEEYDDVYKFIYNNLQLWTTDEDKKDEAVIIIAKYLDMHSRVIDVEINLAACLIELGRL